MLTIIIGNSGTGKDFLFRSLLNNQEINVLPIISSTNRPMRNGEVNHREYNFYSDKDLNILRNTPNYFLEERCYKTIDTNGKETNWYYCSPRVNPKNTNYLTILDCAGALTYIKEYGIKNIEVIYVTASIETRKQRVFLRDTTNYNADEWNRRLQTELDTDEKICVINNILQQEQKNVHIFNNDKNSIEEAKENFKDLYINILSNNIIDISKSVLQKDDIYER